jgi:serine/threonine protein kinase
MEKLDSELTVEEQRQLYKLCWQFEEAWDAGQNPQPEAWASKINLTQVDVLEELLAVERELQARPVPLVVTPVEQTNVPETERYQFMHEIARGGAGAVWRVFDRHLQRETAAKFLLEKQDNAEMRRRLELEARLCGRLRHPGIVPIHELSHFADGRPFITMKLIEGETFHDLLDKTPPMQMSARLHVFERVCEAVGHAHECGIIHRDLKPGNIMVGKFGEVQVTDWGLAKDLKTNDASDLANVTQSNAQVDTLMMAPPKSTVFGTVFGTMAYLSPEQARGELNRIDCRSDVFSLGSILCKLLTGQPAYHAERAESIQTMAETADLTNATFRLRKSSGNRKLAQLALDCMALSPDQRPSDAKSIVNRLRKIRQDGVKKKWLAVSLLLILLGAVAVLATNYQQPMESPVVAATKPTSEPTVSDSLDSLTTSETFQVTVHDAEAVIDLADVMVQRGDYDQAERLFRRTVEFTKNDRVRLHLGELLRARQRYEESEAVLRELIHDRPRFVYAHRSLAATLHQLHRQHDAVEILNQALAIEPNQRDILKDLVKMLVKYGMNDQFLAIFGKAIRSNPNDAELQRIVDQHLQKISPVDSRDR